MDNPAWNALNTGNTQLANGNDQVKYFSKEVSPFFGLKDNSDDDFATLHELITHDSPVGFISPVEREISGKWKLLRYIQPLQMIFNGVADPLDETIEIITLTNEHVPQMLALTKLTNPGPFDVRTIDFGHYRGIFDGDRLVAMAGQRMHPVPYAEISAVCTHPDYLGKGYARQLLLYQVHRIRAASGIPILHVLHDNERAIKVYESLGFSTRKQMHFYILQKN